MEQARRSTTRWRRRTVQVGGDRHDAFQVSDGSTELVVGDVSGHDREAAAVMAQVRSVLRGTPRSDRAATMHRRSSPGRPSSSTPTAGATGRPAGPLTDGHPARAGDQSWKSVLTLSSSHWSASARAVRSTCR
jgi:stage II sporulation SpoE-like protein